MSEDIEASVGLRLAFRLTPQETSLMLLLLTMEFVSNDLIYERLNVATEVRVAIYRLRRSLKRYQISIESKRNFGYWLNSETKAKVKALITRKV